MSSRVPGTTTEGERRQRGRGLRERGAGSRCRARWARIRVITAGAVITITSHDSQVTFLLRQITLFRRLHFGDFLVVRRHAFLARRTLQPIVNRIPLLAGRNFFYQ